MTKEVFLKNAENSFMNNDREECVRSYKLALSEDPSDANIWTKYINTLIAWKMYKGAKEVAHQASTLNLRNFKLEEINAKINQKEQYSLSWRLLDQSQLESLEQLLNRRDFDNLEKTCQELLKENSKSPLLYNLIGCAIQDDARQNEIFSAFKTAITLKPDYVEAMNNYGVALEKFGKYEEALRVLHNAVEINSRYSNAFYNLGNVYRKLKNFEEAYKSYQLAIKFNPKHIVAMNNLGVMLLDFGKINLSIENLKKATDIDPTYFDALYNLGNAYFKRLDCEKANEVFQKALELNDQDPKLLNNFGTSLMTSGEIGRAISMFKNAVKLNNQYSDAYNNLGIAFSNSAETDNAKESLKTAIDLRPTYAEAHRHLSMLHEYKPCDDHLKQMLDLLECNQFDNKNRYHIHFALAKAYEDLQQYEDSFKHLREGNKQRKRLLNYDISEDIALFENLTARDPLDLSEVSRFKELVTEPIFIVGMPRSGTTLIEQIISAHPEVSGAGELNFIAQLSKSINLDNPNRRLEHSDLEYIRGEYIDKVTKRGHNAQFFTDKMPHNFRFINLIFAAFPEAKIVHVVRAPSATCWSNYKHCFTTNELEYSYDLEDTITFYQLYSKLMATWYEAFGDRIIHLNYECLVQEPETYTRNLIKELNIHWSDACLEPHNNQRSVLTASQRQVRKKIYSGSSKAWAKYENFISEYELSEFKRLDEIFWAQEKEC